MKIVLSVYGAILVNKPEFLYASDFSPSHRQTSLQEIFQPHILGTRRRNVFDLSAGSLNELQKPVKGSRFIEKFMTKFAFFF